MRGSDYPNLHHRGHGGHRGLISNDTPDSVAQVGNIEVDEQPELIATQFQVRQNLREMEGQQFLHRLEFHNYAVFDDEVDSIRCVELNAVVDDRKTHLMCERNAIFGELVAEARVIRAFEATGSKSGMYFESRSENPVCDPNVQGQLISSVSSAVASFVLQAAVR